MAISNIHQPVIRVLTSLFVILALPQVVAAMSLAPNSFGSLQQTCETFSKQDGYEYFAVSGQVVESRIKGIEPPVDCVGREKCHPLQGMATVYTQMISDETGKAISIRTKPESYEKLKSMEKPYLEVDKSYAFCARKESSKTSHYSVDHPETIQPVE